MYMNNKASILILGLLVMSVALLIGGIFLSLSLINYEGITVSGNLIKSEWIAYAGINQAGHDIKEHLFDRDYFLNLQQKWLNGVQFGEGMYRIGILPVRGFGTREIIIVSLGTNTLETKVGRYSSSAFITRLQIYTPTDYLYFFDGNGNITTYYDLYASILGSVHANGSLFLDGGPNPGYLRIVKPDDEDIVGPTVSATGIIFRGSVKDTWETYPNFNAIEIPIIIGVGNIQEIFSKNNLPYYEGLTYGTESNNLEIKDFYITRFVTSPYSGPLATTSIPSYKNSPDITFPITRQDGNIEHLLIDGKHGAYKINIPKKDKIFSYFEPYIDKTFKINYNNLNGGKIISFYNDVIKVKQPLEKSGDEYIFLNLGSEIVNNINYTPPYISGIDWVYLPSYSYYYTYYLPYQDRGLYDLRVNNVSKIFGLDYVYSPIHDTHLNKLIFKPGSVSVGQTVTTNKLKYLYATNKVDNYKASPSNSEPAGIQISPLTIESFNDDGGIWGRIKLRTSITDLRTIYYVTANYFGANRGDTPFDKTLMSFLTCSLINTSTAIWTTIGGYSYDYVGGSGNYGTHFRLFPMESFNTGFDETLTLVDITGTPVDTSIDRRFELYYSKKAGWVSYYNKDTPFTVNNRPVIKYNEDSNAWYGWIGLPLIDTSLTYNLKIWDKSTNSLFRNLASSEYTLVVNPPLITVTDPAKSDLANNPNYVLLITYQSTYREIIDVTGTINTTEVYGYDSLCTDELVKAVTIDLSTITESNYPKDGVIFSEVPLIVFGIPQKKITIVSLENVYVGNINASYRDIKGNWINSSLTIDDPNAEPVAIISAKAIFSYHNPNNIAPLVANLGLPDYDITLNKVILYTQSNGVFNYGGLRTLDTRNKLKLIGSMILGNALAITQKDIYYYKDYIDFNEHQDTNYGSFILKKEMYSKSFREEIPPHIPMTIHQLEWRKVSSDKAENSIKILQTYLDKGNIQKDIYREIIKNLLSTSDNE